MWSSKADLCYWFVLHDIQDLFKFLKFVIPILSWGLHDFQTSPRNYCQTGLMQSNGTYFVELFTIESSQILPRIPRTTPQCVHPKGATGFKPQEENGLCSILCQNAVKIASFFRKNYYFSTCNEYRTCLPETCLEKLRNNLSLHKCIGKWKNISKVNACASFAIHS